MRQLGKKDRREMTRAMYKYVPYLLLTDVEGSSRRKPDYNDSKYSKHHLKHDLDGETRNQTCKGNVFILYFYYCFIFILTPLYLFSYENCIS